MPESVWASRPADLYGRRDRDRIGALLWGIRVVLEGFASASRWEPSRVQPVRRTQRAVITRRELVALDVVALTLADAGGGLLPAWTPGAHIDVRLPSGRRRQYSLCGRRGGARTIASQSAGSPTAAVARSRCTMPSTWATRASSRARETRSIGTAEHDVLFVIGGIGVTPILPKIRVAAERGISWRAIYAGRRREYMPLLDEVVSVDPDRVTVWADDERGGFATANDLLAGAGPATAVYVCGPGAMLEAVRVARDEHVGAPLHYERFSPPPVVDGVPFELELARSRQVLSVPANRSALDVLLDHDPTTPHSCRQGFCGTCKVKVLAGQVEHCGRTAVGGGHAGLCVAGERRPAGHRRVNHRRGRSR